MAVPVTTADFLEVVRRSNQVDLSRLDACLQTQKTRGPLPEQPHKLAALLIRAGLLTNFQAEQFLQGKYRGFSLGGYRIIERLARGGSGTVYLAEHEVMKRRVAIKVLPSAYAQEAGVVERFRREAQAVAALDHPHIVRAYDFRQEANLHFLVMEYVEGTSLQGLLSAQGPLPIGQAADYIRQAALGLQHAHEAGLVHRDIKPANLLVDPRGLVKVADLGLVRHNTPDGKSFTQQFDENAVIGTADYLAPEQAINLHDVDGRADIYSLGVTFYALLAGQPPFHHGTVTQKLLWHQMHAPRPLDLVRPDVPAGLAQIVHRMLAKHPTDRYANPAEVVDALENWAEGPWPPGPGPKPSCAQPRSTSSAAVSVMPPTCSEVIEKVDLEVGKKTPPLKGEGRQTASCSPSPLRGGGWGEGFFHELSAEASPEEVEETPLDEPEIVLPPYQAPAPFWVAVLFGSVLPVVLLVLTALGLVWYLTDAPHPAVERVQTTDEPEQLLAPGSLPAAHVKRPVN